MTRPFDARGSAPYRPYFESVPISGVGADICARVGGRAGNGVNCDCPYL